MKIYDQNPLGSTGSAHGASGAEAVEARSGARGAAGSRVEEDRAVLSGLAGRLSQALEAESPERAARVEQLRAEVASGRYRADALGISRGIVREALSNSGAKGNSKT
ncbi:MAG: flagellar biosynthesis anti-sigma factor FlgM [Acidobacteria bacterium]|nr:flagellar biosynthesis anti-sigma factor FlgM [Acidobacteriota bacterium]MBI3470559.1 flagellar biosynthesis anti-sigma factor FlgM [Candidatus Solibacter usitatus]